MKCIKTALAHTTRRKHRSRYNAPSLCAQIFCLLHHSVRRFTRKRPGLSKSSCLPIAVPGLLPGEGKAAQAVSSFSLASSSGEPQFPAAQLASETPLWRQPGIASQPHAGTKGSLTLPLLGRVCGTFLPAPEEKNLFAIPPEA